MNEQKAIILEKFLKNIDTLYDNISSWLSPYGLSTIQEETKITEEISGTYKANKITIQNEKEETMRKHHACWCLGYRR